MTPHEIISLKISELDVALKQAHPTMPSLLRDIHRTLQNDSDTVTLLSPSEVSIIVAGLSAQTQTTIIASILSKNKGKTGKNIGVDDI